MHHSTCSFIKTLKPDMLPKSIARGSHQCGARQTPVIDPIVVPTIIVLYHVVATSLVFVHNLQNLTINIVEI